MSALCYNGCWRINCTLRQRNANSKLKVLFTSPPILIHPDPEKPFIVELDASDVGVGGVLSKRSGTASKLHPCPFFSPLLIAR